MEGSGEGLQEGSGECDNGAQRQKQDEFGQLSMAEAHAALRRERNPATGEHQSDILVWQRTRKKATGIDHCYVNITTFMVATPEEAAQQLVTLDRICEVVPSWVSVPFILRVEWLYTKQVTGKEFNMKSREAVSALVDAFVAFLGEVINWAIYPHARITRDRLCVEECLPLDGMKPMFQIKAFDLPAGGTGPPDQPSMKDHQSLEPQPSRVRLELDGQYTPKAPKWKPPAPIPSPSASCQTHSRKRAHGSTDMFRLKSQGIDHTEKKGGQKKA